MENKMGAVIPDNWFIETGTHWPYKEGIPVNKDTENILRLIAVHQNLLDIPQCREHLDKCNKKFLDKFARVLLALFKPVVRDAQIGRRVKTPTISTCDDEKIISIYKEWADTWALGSNKMLAWVANMNIFKIMLGELPLNRPDYRRFKNRITKIGKHFPMPDEWNILLSGDYRRMNQAKRELSRRKVQSAGYYRKRERELLTHARYWIAVRVLGYGETEFIELLSQKNYDTGIEISNFSNSILKPFDDAMTTERPKPGRPFGARTNEYRKTGKKYLTQF